jgi:hypothetical protein
MTLNLIFRMITPSDIRITLYLCHMMSKISLYLRIRSLWHGTCAAEWSWLRVPGRSAAIANMLGTGVQLDSDDLDPAHGLVAVDATRGVSWGRLEVIAKRNF